MITGREWHRQEVSQGVRGLQNSKAWVQWAGGETPPVGGGKDGSKTMQGSSHS